MYTDNDIARFQARLGAPDERGCQEWLGSKAPAGYGRFWAQGKTRSAHRVAWEIAHNQQVPDELLIRHTCDWPSCAAAAHVVSGTPLDNSRDMVERGRATFGDRNPARQPGWKLKGEQHPQAVLTEKDVAYIRERYAVGDITQAALAKTMGVSRAAIAHALCGRNWPGRPNEHKVRRSYVANRGSAHGNAKLTEADVVEMRRLKSTGILVKNIAKQFGIEFGHAKAICAGRVWTHVPMPEMPDKFINQHQ